MTFVALFACGLIFGLFCEAYDILQENRRD